MRARTRGIQGKTKRQAIITPWRVVCRSYISAGSVASYTLSSRVVGLAILRKWTQSWTDRRPFRTGDIPARLSTSFTFKLAGVLLALVYNASLGTDRASRASVGCVQRNGTQHVASLQRLAALKTALFREHSSSILSVMKFTHLL